MAIFLSQLRTNIWDLDIKASFLSARERKPRVSSDHFCLPQSLSQISLYKHQNIQKTPLARKFKSKRIPKRISKDSMKNFKEHSKRIPTKISNQISKKKSHKKEMIDRILFSKKFSLFLQSSTPA